jgi:hypothetical protein
MFTNRQQLRMLAVTTLTSLTVLGVAVRERLTGARERHRHPDDGYTTETVIVTALLVAAAITIIGIIIAKVLAKANSITM